MGDELDRAAERIQEGWLPLREAVDAMSDEAMSDPTAAGWTVKEMLAHVAFWDEAAVPVVTYMNRGKEIPPGAYFGSGYRPGDTWPADNVHNAREAGWARNQDAATVRERLARAHEAMLAALRALSDEEVTAQSGYLNDQPGHYEEHLAELQRALGAL